MTKQEVVHEVFQHAVDSRKQYVPKSTPSRNLTEKEIGFEGKTEVEQSPEDKAKALKNGESLAQKAPEVSKDAKANATIGPRDQTRQEVVHEVFQHAEDAKKQYVPKPNPSRNLTEKEIGFEGKTEVEQSPEDKAKALKNGESLAQESPAGAVANAVANSDKSVEEPKAKVNKTKEAQPSTGETGDTAVKAEKTHRELVHDVQKAAHDGIIQSKNVGTQKIKVTIALLAQKDASVLQQKSLIQQNIESNIENGNSKMKRNKNDTANSNTTLVITQDFVGVKSQNMAQVKDQTQQAKSSSFGEEVQEFVHSWFGL